MEGNETEYEYIIHMHLYIVTKKCGEQKKFKGYKN